MSKVCSKCSSDKPTSEFYRHNKMPDGLQHWCKSCWREYEKSYAQKPDTILRRREAARKRYRENPERYRASKQKWASKNPGKVVDYKYGLGASIVYDRLLLEQGGRCAFCLCETALSRDHDHVTGQPRWLLCKSCNLGLGLFKDDPTILERAAKLLRAKQQDFGDTT